MTVALTDLMIQLADPATQREFRRDPRKFLSAAGLSPIEQDAVLEGDLVRLRSFARSTESTDPDQQFNRIGTIEAGLHVEPTVELVLEHHDMIAIGPQSLLFVDGEGRLFRAIPEER